MFVQYMSKFTLVQFEQKYALNGKKTPYMRSEYNR